MNQKATQIVIGLVVIVVIAVGAYVSTHKSTKSTASTSTGQIVQTKTSSSVGAYLADANGKALYTYEHDSTGVSNCTGSCLANWPAYIATGSTSSLPAHVGTFKRSDGPTQYTYNGMPLYTFISDSQAGSVTGDGSEGFHVAKPATSATTQAVPAPATPAPAPAAATPSTMPPAASPTPSPSPAYKY